MKCNSQTQTFRHGRFASEFSASRQPSDASKLFSSQPNTKADLPSAILCKVLYHSAIACPACTAPYCSSYTTCAASSMVQINDPTGKTCQAATCTEGECCTTGASTWFYSVFPRICCSDGALLNSIATTQTEIPSAPSSVKHESHRQKITNFPPAASDRFYSLNHEVKLRRKSFDMGRFASE